MPDLASRSNTLHGAFRNYGNCSLDKWVNTVIKFTPDDVTGTIGPKH